MEDCMGKKNTGLVILIIILFLLIICLGGYIVYDKVFSGKIDDDVTDKNDNNIDGNGNTNVTDEQDNNNVNKNDNKSSVNVSDVINDYKKILKEKKNSNYYLYDMNSDGIPELFIVSGDSEATKEIFVYTYNDNPNLKYADDIISVGDFGCGHSNI